MDTLTLSGLTYHANHGVYEKERTEGNRFEVDLIFKADLRTAGRDDDLAETIDYEQAEEIVRRVMEGPSVQLIETLVSKIGTQLFNRYSRVKSLEVRVRKLSPPLPSPADYSQVAFTWKR